MNAARLGAAIMRFLGGTGMEPARGGIAPSRMADLTRLVRHKRQAGGHGAFFGNLPVSTI